MRLKQDYKDMSLVSAPKIKMRKKKKKKQKGKRKESAFNEDVVVCLNFEAIVTIKFHACVT